MLSDTEKQQDELLDLIFSSKGPLSLGLDDFEERKGQREMSGQIMEAYSKDQIALIEAGTGTGKSLAYLVPAIFWALKSKEKTVISTNTIALQEQLINKDIPFLLRTLNLDLSAVLVKGMHNYLCLRKLHDLNEQMNSFTEEHADEIESVDRWAQHSVEGSRSEIHFPLSAATWEKVGAEADACNHVHCPNYRKCFFFKARRKAEDAQILVVNHHLLLADLIAKQVKENEKSILPNYDRLILDEAHHVEEIAFDALSKRMDNIRLPKLLGKLFSEINPQKSRLGTLKQTLATVSQSSILSFMQRLDIDLPAKKRNLIELNTKMFDQLDQFCSFAPKSDFREQSILLKDPLSNHPQWKGEIKSGFLEFSSSLNNFAQSVHGLCQDLEALKDPILQEKMQTDLVEICAIVSRLEEYASNLEHFFSQDKEIHNVRWIERNGSILALVEANLDVSSYLKEHLLESVSTIAMCSATLTVGEDFDYIKQRLGISSIPSHKQVTERVYDSPFDYQNQSLLLIPTDIPDPLDKEFIPAASKSIFHAVEASKGNAFVLFTSYDMLRACHSHVLSLAEGTDFTFLRQGDASRQSLIERFKSKDKSVLFGTDSFWEGVDIAGDALRCVILVKLPFKVPNHPKTQAYSELLLQIGKDPFRDDSLPHAALKFKQGFGRLIRTKHDKGCVVCLDKRIVTKSYGKRFLKSLPNCKVIKGDSKHIFASMEEFYGA
ncbi:MAG TPA: helicase C-terminal domain-containing protein [Rhabdochlamydiaceae bacterium]|nr:helicase C-terminal domain-containing protein [Rhabdochlamydiaceae bacterium]